MKDFDVANISLGGRLDKYRLVIIVIVVVMVVMVIRVVMVMVVMVKLFISIFLAVFE